MKALTAVTTLILLLGALLGPQPARAQDRELKAGSSSEWQFMNLKANATSVPLRLGSGDDARIVDTGPITIGGSGRGSIDPSRGTGPATWQVTASAPGLQEQGIGSLSLTFVGTAVHDGDCLFVVDVAGIGGGAQAPTPVPQIPPIIIINCNKPGGDCSPSIPPTGAAPDRGPTTGPVEFSSLTSADLRRFPIAKMVTEAAQMAGLSLTPKEVDLVMKQYQRQPTMELVVLDRKTGETFSSDLRGGGTLEFKSR